MASIDQLKDRIGLNDLCEHLGMKRDGKLKTSGEALYHSPVRKDKNASFSVYRRKGELRWKDHASDEGGSIIDLVIYTSNASDTGEAIRWLHQEFNIPFDKPDAPARERSREEWLADQVLQKPEEALPYLVDERRLCPDVIKQAISAKTLGYSDYTRTDKKAGEKFHGGPAVAFICRDFTSKRVTTVEYRYFDKELNGGLKTHCHGEKGPAFWCLSHNHIKAAHTIVLVESPINVLSMHCTKLADMGWAALATMGASNLHEKDWPLLEGKRVICAFDNDAPDEKTGYRPGARAAWKVHEKLTALNMPCLFADQITGNKWEGVNDLNDFLTVYGLEAGRSNLRSALQECYQFTVTRRGTDMTEYVQCAPVLLAGEDVPVQSLLGKVIRSDLSGRKGDMLPENLPRFPVREWIRWLATLERQRVRELYEKCRLFLMERSATSGEDDGANRMIGNYAALYCAWRLICEFLEMPSNQGEFPLDLLTTMNNHVTESSADREPWVWITEIILGEIDANNFKYPYKFEPDPDNEGESLLYIRFKHMMQHLSTSNSLRAKFDAMPVKSATVFARQVKDAGVCPERFRDKERTIGGKRVAHLFGLSLKELERFGLSVSVPEVQENGYHNPDK